MMARKILALIIRYSEIKNSDGTDYIVSKRGKRKFTTSLYIIPENVIKIRGMIDNGMGDTEIAHEMGVNRRAIAKIRAGKTYQWIK